jgi:hypothetical protein
MTFLIKMLPDDFLIHSNVKLDYAKSKIVSESFTIRYFEQAGADLLNKSSCFATAIGVTKFTFVRYDFGHTAVLLKPDLDVQQAHLTFTQR